MRDKHVGVAFKPKHLLMPGIVPSTPLNQFIDFIITKVMLSCDIWQCRFYKRQRFNVWVWIGESGTDDNYKVSLVVSWKFVYNFLSPFCNLIIMELM